MSIRNTVIPTGDSHQRETYMRAEGMIEGSVKVNKPGVDMSKCAQILAFPVISSHSRAEAVAAGGSIAGATGMDELTVVLPFDKAAIRAFNTFSSAKCIPTMDFWEVGEQGGQPAILRQLTCTQVLVSGVVTYFDFRYAKIYPECLFMRLTFQITEMNFAKTQFALDTFAPAGSNVSSQSNVKQESSS
ncbi:MAG: type VI secretion system tube protein Hcp [Alphaproteobacteria bacterium]|nr:type VI secretion system tube protein Hcp [Alphaproteobacteria bacterium]